MPTYGKAVRFEMVEWKAEVALMTATMQEPVLVSTDARNRISLGKHGKGLYRVMETSYGYTVERVEVVSERDKQLANNKEFWEKATEDWDVEAEPMRLKH